MFRRTLVSAGALALVFATAATAADVKIRVEGKTQTIFAPAERHITADNALEALRKAAAAGEFFVDVQQTAYGPYVDQVGMFPAFGFNGWTYKVNGVSPPVGADQYALKTGDHVLWYWATFGEAGGPPTLELDRDHGNCYRVFAVDDTGAKSGADGAVLHVGSKRTVSTRKGKDGTVGCVGKHRGLLVRATLEGDIRSNALR